MKIEDTSLKNAQDCNKGRGTKTNKIEFRIPADKQWIVESMTKFYYENEQILEPNKNQVARLALNLLAKNYIDQDGILNQELEGLVPIRYYHKLEQEFGEAKEQLAQQKDYIARCDTKTHDNILHNKEEYKLGHSSFTSLTRKK